MKLASVLVLATLASASVYAYEQPVFSPEEKKEMNVAQQEQDRLAYQQNQVWNSLQPVCKFDRFRSEDTAKLMDNLVKLISKPNDSVAKTSNAICEARAELLKNPNLKVPDIDRFLVSESKDALKEKKDFSRFTREQLVAGFKPLENSNTKK